MNSLKQEVADYLNTFITERRRDLFKRVLDNRTYHARVVMENVCDAQDASAVMRSCEIFGIQKLDIITRGPLGIKQGVAVGASKWISLQRHLEQPGAHETTSSVLNGLKKEGFRLIALTTRPGTKPLAEVSLDQPVALCLGAEPNGLSETTYNLADETATLPAAGFTGTFNISVTAALCLSQVSARLRSEPISWQLDPEARLDLELEWLAKMPKSIKLLMERFLEDLNLAPSALNQFPETFRELAV